MPTSRYGVDGNGVGAGLQRLDVLSALLDRDDKAGSVGCDELAGDGSGSRNGDHGNDRRKSYELQHRISSTFGVPAFDRVRSR